MEVTRGRGREAIIGHTRGRRIVVGCVVLGLTQMAGFCGPSDPGPCGIDRFNCDDGDANAFVQRDQCAPIAETLSIEIGGGYDTLKPFDTASEPPFERGGQGGQHLTTAYRVGGADLVQSERLRVSLRMLQQDTGCDGDAPDASSGDTGHGCEVAVGQRVMVRGGPTFPLKPDGEGFITEAGIIVILDYWGPVRLPFRLVATVEDQCGRTAESEVVFVGAF